VVCGAWGCDLGLLPDAQSRSFNCRAAVGGRAVAGHWRGSPALYAKDQLPREVAGLFVAGAFCFVRDGRAVPAGGRAVGRVEPGAGTAGGGARRVALEQRAGTPFGMRRPFGEGSAVAGDGSRVARVARQCFARGAVAGVPRAQPHGASARRRVLRGAIGGSGWSHLDAPKRRPAQTARKLVLCPRI